MRVTLPLLRIPPARAPILRYGVAVLSTALALIPTVLLADVSESRLALFGVAVMVRRLEAGSRRHRLRPHRERLFLASWAP
jgi:CO/xanthine dehydrogenase FAD-binding subunit